jgi:hypothetical protein
MKSSAARVSASARRIASSGIDCPKETVAVLTMPTGAIEAARIGRVAVQLDHLFLGEPRGLMKPVDVLSDDRGRPATTDQFGDGPVTAVRLRLTQRRVDGKAAAPSLAPGRFRCHEGAEIDGRLSRPDAAGTAEIGNSRFSADPRPGEDGDAPGLPDQLLEREDVAVEGHESLWQIWHRRPTTVEMRMRACPANRHAPLKSRDRIPV